jgi:hypothetical protein
MDLPKEPTMNKLIAGLAFVAMSCTASTITNTKEVKPEPKRESATVQASALRAATQMIYNVGAIDTNKSILPQAIAAVRVPEPNTNFMIGAGLLGVAYLLQRKTKQS